MKNTLLIASAGLALALDSLAQPVFSPMENGRVTAIRPGALWPDNFGHHIQAHGGGVIRIGDTFYWFGEDRGGEVGRRVAERSIACYASTDLMNWEFRRQVIRTGPPEEGIGTPFVLERPKVYHDTVNNRFVMWAHLDDAPYRLARVAIFTSDTIDGDYTYVRSFRPLDQESRDIGQFIDDDGRGYLIFEARPTRGFFIAKLTPDFMDIEREVCFIRSRLEGGAIVKYDGLYYLIGSWMSGWDPNPNQFATATSLEGPWSEFRDIAPPETRTYGSQTTFLLKVVGSETTSVIFMGDMWRPRQHRDGRYYWMPVEIGGGNLRLPPPADWTIDVKTGRTTLLGP